jgi:hypothetical protein
MKMENDIGVELLKYEIDIGNGNEFEKKKRKFILDDNIFRFL